MSDVQEGLVPFIVPTTNPGQIRVNAAELGAIFDTYPDRAIPVKTSAALLSQDFYGEEGSEHSHEVALVVKALAKEGFLRAINIKRHHVYVTTGHLLIAGRDERHYITLDVLPEDEALRQMPNGIKPVDCHRRHTGKPRLRG